MAIAYNNIGPVTVAESVRDVTNNFNYHVTKAIGSSTVPPKKISFKPIPEPHTTFIGRVEYVKLAINYLCHPVATDAQIQFPFLVIHALGGYGKTQTARKIVSDCRKEQKFHHFIWIDSADEMVIKKCFVAVRKQSGLATTDETFQSPNFDVLVHQFYDLLVRMHDEKFLIIFDNVEDFDTILEFLPLNYPASNIAVLMTSQRPFTRRSYGNVKNQRLELMLEDEAMQLVENVLGKSSMDFQKDKKRLVDRSGRITLVLCVMASTIQFQRSYNNDYRINDYLVEMNDQPIQYSDEANVLDLTYDKSLQKIVRFAVDRLNAVGGPLGQIAVQIFDRVAYLSSTNKLTSGFVETYLRYIRDEANKVDIKLPVKPINDLQIIRMAIEKLSEFSLAQLSNNIFTVHRWIQVSRRLDLKESGDEINVLNELIFSVADIGTVDENISILWQHVADYADLVSKFYMKERTLLKFPVFNVDVLEKIIGGLVQTGGVQQFENCSEEIEFLIHRLILFSNLDALERTVNALNYDVRKKSKEFISTAILSRNVNVIKWLINDMSCIPEEYNLRECFESDEITRLTPTILRRLKPLNVDVYKLIEKGHGKNLLEILFLSESTNLGQNMYEISECIKMFEIIVIMLGALRKSKPPSIDLSEIIEKYSEKYLLECLLICGRPHCGNQLDNSNDKFYLEWTDVHLAASRNQWNDTLHPTLTELKSCTTNMTPLMCAALGNARQTATMLLENYSANVNAMDNNGWTPLTYAIKNDHPTLVKMLLSHGAKTNWKTEFGKASYALHDAVKSYSDYESSQSEQIVDAILTSEDCDVSATDLNGSNILHMLVEYYYATRYKPNHRMLQLILSKNATLVNMENNTGMNPVQLAKSLMARFTGDHWHVKSLANFISELDKVCNHDNMS